MIKRTCKRCNKAFLAFPSRIKKWGAVYCSRDCSNKSTALKGKDSPHWVGDEVGYWGIHDWLQTNFGKADCCENNDCLGKSKKFQWAKIKNVPYARKRENFQKLCARCHIVYDNTSVKGGWNKGKKWSKDVRKRISIGTKLGMAKLNTQ